MRYYLIVCLLLIALPGHAMSPAFMALMGAVPPPPPCTSTGTSTSINGISAITKGGTESTGVATFNICGEITVNAVVATDADYYTAVVYLYVDGNVVVAAVAPDYGSLTTTLRYTPTPGSHTVRVLGEYGMDATFTANNFVIPTY